MRVKPQRASLARLATVSGAAAFAVVMAAPAHSQSAERPAAEASQQSAHDRLYQLFKESDEASLKRNPMQALFRGDPRYAGQMGDRFTDEHFAAEYAAAQHDLQALHSIPRDQLNATDQIAYDTFEWMRKDQLANFGPEVGQLIAVLPMNHFFGLHKDYPTMVSGKGAAPYNTLQDYENSLKLNHDFVRNVDNAIAQWRKGMAEGVVDSKLTVTKMIDQLDLQLADKPEDSPYYGPIKQFPDAIGAGDRARFAQQYHNAIVNEIYPELTKLRNFLKNEYLPHARDGEGLKYMKGGDKLYRYIVESETTLPVSPEEVHQLGLKEVARITGEFEKVKDQIGFKGDLHQFFDYMRTSPKFQPKSREQIEADYARIKAEVEPKLPQYFSQMPKAALVIRPTPDYLAKFEAGGSYDSGTPDGSRPGIFYYNSYDLPSRSTWRETTLFLHEGEPGHHFQISLAQEIEALPAFMRFTGPDAFAEGWALYAETLGYDMGLYKDPYQHFGTLNDEMLRAMRLVVDTGIHAKGWSRDQALQYMLDHSGMSRTDATAEVERYIGNPGQALAYKFGSVTIQRLRKKAQDELGPKFDIREFHAQVLDTGALPLGVLEHKIDAWIARKEAAPAA